MKAQTIEVSVPTENVVRIQPVLEQCLAETGAELIGQQAYDDLTLFVVRLLVNIDARHIRVLAQAFHADLITSFQVISCYLFRIAFKPCDFEKLLRSFPLRGGESFFTAYQQPYTAYLCLGSPNLNQEQIAWLARDEHIEEWKSIY